MVDFRIMFYDASAKVDSALTNPPPLNHRRIVGTPSLPARRHYP